MPLYHFSEEPRIEVFEPRPVTRELPPYPEGEPLVWAIEEWHQPMYFFPRDCPRILLWPLPDTSEADRERWFGASSARMLAHLEWDWLERMRWTHVYRYTLPDGPFESLEDAGMYVSRATVEPLAVEPVGDLLEALRNADVEVRLLERLTPLRGVWSTTLHASGIRLRNAHGWDQQV